VAAVLSNLPTGARIALTRLRSLGDCVLTTPALRILKHSRPDLNVAVVVEDRFREVFEGSPDVQAVLPPSALALARWHPELCLNLHGGTRSLVLTAASRARHRAGFEHFRASRVYTLRIPRAQEILGEERVVHTAEHIASAMFYLGAERQPVPRACLPAVPTARPAKPYAVVHPFAATPAKTWPRGGFLAVARTLRHEHELEVVIAGAAADDFADFHEEFRVAAGAPLRDVMSLMAGASLFIGNDSGPAHIAAAYGVPCIVLFGPSDSAVWAPWQTEAEVLTSRGADIGTIEVSQVLNAIAQLRVAR
jgi:ADP-heptose:LPS heptosyltransferase